MKKRATTSSTQLQLWTKEKTSLETSATQHRKSHGSALHVFPSVFFADRTPKRLELTLEVAEGTLNRSAEVLQTITPISKKVEKWANNMRNKEYSTAAYEQAVLSAGEAGAAASDSGCWLSQSFRSVVIEYGNLSLPQWRTSTCWCQSCWTS